MRETTRAQRNAVHCNPQTLDGLEASRGIWFESDAEVKAGLRWGRRKAELLRWVRRHMAQRLTMRERRCIELHYLESLPFKEVGTRERCSASSAHRAVARALRKLRCAVEEDPSWRAYIRKGGRTRR